MKIYFIVNETRQWEKYKAFSHSNVSLVTEQEVMDNMELFEKEIVLIDNTQNLTFVNFLKQQGYTEEKDTTVRREFIRYKSARFYIGTEDIPKLMYSFTRIVNKYSSDKVEEKFEIDKADTIIVESKDRTFHLVKKIPLEKEKGINYLTIDQVKELGKVFDIIDSME